MAHCKRRGKPLPFPIIADETREIANMLNIIDPEEVDSKTKMPLTSRAVFFINPKKEMRSMILYPATTGRYQTVSMKYDGHLLMLRTTSTRVVVVGCCGLLLYLCVIVFRLSCQEF
eukprot:GHVS01094995.1.p1 GENE.GHVS01094995.1~~GHVS01094995.1.p1  ORF type:complete len:116 (+),score=15.66 GHVS01094995.1:239-586(+)